MKKRSVIKGVVGGAATAGILAILYAKAKSRLMPKPVKVSVNFQTTDMKILSNDCKKHLNQKREECLKTINGKTDRQMAALLFDCEESGLSLIEYIRPEVEILSNNASVSALSQSITFLLSPIITFAIALLSTVLLISFKWKIEQTVSTEIVKMLNPLIIISVAIVVHLLMNIVNAFIKYAPKRSNEVTIGVKLGFSKESVDLFMNTQLNAVKRDIVQIAKVYASPAKLDDPILNLLSEAYCDIYQAEKIGDMTDVFGFIMPKCAAALKKMDVDILETYSDEKAGYFSVIEAPGYKKSTVIKPALLLRNEGSVINKGEYVKSI